MASLCRML